ncbi:TPA: oligosaccharide flippase family protein [Yersinia enterocolitica]|nr:oligosaccharide flippase family protein [Yersinia enterocolitica]
MNKKIKIFLNNKVLNASIWYIISDFFSKGIVFITLPIFTRIMNTSEFGMYSLFNSWVSIFTIFIGLNLTSSVFRYKYDNSAKHSEFTSSISFLAVIVLFGFMGIFVIFQDYLLDIMGISLILFLLIVFNSFFNFIKEILITKMRTDYQYKGISIINIFSTICNILLSIYLIQYVFIENRDMGRILGQSIITFIVGIIILIYIILKGKTLVNIEYWKYGLSFSLPLIVHSLSSVINNQFDRIMINHYIGESATGIYSFAYTIGTIIMILWSSSNQAFSPWFFEKMQEKNYEKIREKSVYYRGLFTFIYAMILFVTPEIIKLIAEESYWDGLNLVPWIFMSYYFLFLVSFEAKVEQYFKRNKLVSLGTLISALINIVLNVILIPIYGYKIAAITTVISYLFMLIFHYIFTSKVIKFNIVGMKFYLVSIVYVLGITLYYFLFIDYLLLRIMGFLLLVPMAIRSIKPFINRS